MKQPHAPATTRGGLTARACHTRYAPPHLTRTPALSLTCATCTCHAWATVASLHLHLCCPFHLISHTFAASFVVGTHLPSGTIIGCWKIEPPRRWAGRWAGAVGPRPHRLPPSDSSTDCPGCQPQLQLTHLRCLASIEGQYQNPCWAG